MAFESYLVLNYSDLEQDTQYRLAEVEMVRFIHNYPLGREEAIEYLIDILLPDADEEIISDFHNSTKSYAFNEPRKAEYIDYLRYCNASYAKITALTGISSRTTAKRRLMFPYYMPIFQHWTPEMLQKWNSIKTFFNMWNEQLIHHKSLVK